MKFSLALCSIVLLSAFYNGADYPVAKLYAFQQKVSKGANFSSPEKNKPVVKYLVYVEVKKGRAITVKDVWINGLKSVFNMEQVHTPVMYEKTIRLNKNDDQGILIATTDNNLLQIFINGAEENKSIPSRYKKYPLLIAYKEGKNAYYIGAKAWEEIPAGLTR